MTVMPDPVDRLTVDQAITSGNLKIAGKKEAFTEFLGLLDAFQF